MRGPSRFICITHSRYKLAQIPRTTVLHDREDSTHDSQSQRRNRKDTLQGRNESVRDNQSRNEKKDSLLGRKDFEQRIVECVVDRWRERFCEEQKA